MYSIRNAAALCILVFGPSSAFGGVHLSVSGFTSTTNAELQKTDSSALSAGVSIDIFSMMRLGFTLKRQTNMTSGSLEHDSIDPTSFSDELVELKRSLDLTIVPFYTQTFVPFILGGVAQKEYDRCWKSELYNNNSEQCYELKPGVGDNPLFVWNAGVGVRIPLNKTLAVKLVHYWSEGRTRNPGDNEVKETLDTNAEYGITYTF